jgi:hypothetical protein
VEKMKQTINIIIGLTLFLFTSCRQGQTKTSEKTMTKQNAIQIGLDRFADLYVQLDTEDRERVCSYMEELMDIVGLESSAGHLNNFMFGFDPN